MSRTEERHADGLTAPMGVHTRSQTTARGGSASADPRAAQGEVSHSQHHQARRRRRPTDSDLPPPPPPLQGLCNTKRPLGKQDQRLRHEPLVEEGPRSIEQGLLPHNMHDAQKARRGALSARGHLPMMGLEAPRLCQRGSQQSPGTEVLHPFPRV
jgi:hypothetical protein